MNSTNFSEKYYSKTSPSIYWDYIVIGSGMGGMTSAALLSKLGKKVLVLEQHYIPGGFTHSFKRKKWEWDVGVHAVGEVTKHSMIGRILAKLTNEQLEWESLGEVYEEFYFPDDFRIDFPNNPEKFKQNIYDLFPNSKAAIDKYFDYIKKVSVSMKKYYLSKIINPNFSKLGDYFLAGDAQNFLEKTTQEILDEITNNKKLQTVLAGQWGYYGSPPSRSSFAIHALTAKHFSHGGYYPVGGSRKIAESLLKTVKDAGGWTRIQADVSEVIIKDDSACGIKLKNGQEILSKNVISSIGGFETYERLISPDLKDKYISSSLNKLKPSSAHLCLNIGFKGDISKFGCSGANKWFWETWESEFEYWDIEDPNSIAPVLYTSFPSLKDPNYNAGENELHTGEVVTFVPYSAFEKWKDTKLMKRGEEYEEFKNSIADRMLKQLLTHIPQIEPFIDFVELSTPLSTEYFTRSKNGAIYGIEPTPERFENKYLKPYSPIKKLYLSGSDVGTVGVIGAMLGGLLGATAAEPIKAIKYLKSI